MAGNAARLIVQIAIFHDNSFVAVKKRKKSTKKRNAGKLRIGDNWNAITIIALSQNNPLKAIEVILGELADAVAVGKTMYKPVTTGTRPAGRARSRRRALASADEEPSVPEKAAGRETAVTSQANEKETQKSPAEQAG